MKKIGLYIVILPVVLICTLGAYGQDPLLNILKQELTKQMEELKAKPYPPYYMNYRVVDEYKTVLSASFGALMGDNETHTRSFVPQIRIGNENRDNFINEDMGAMSLPGQGPGIGTLPIGNENIEKAVRQGIWDEVNKRYRYAVDMYHKMEINEKLKIEAADKSPSLAKAPIEHYYEEPLSADKLKVDKVEWAKRLREISGIFKKYPEILDASVALVKQVVRTYFVSSEGTEVVHNLIYVRLMIMAQTMCDDGMQLPLNLSYFAYDTKGIPANEEIIKDAEKLAKTLVALRKAPVVDPYTGPVILSGEASGVFFHEIFGHRIEGQRMRQDSDGQTFKKMIGQFVLPEAFQVYDDPTLKQYKGVDLNGHYKYDEQGVKAERVTVVADGKMNDFLMSRKAMENFPKSNGHARAMGGFDPVSRQSNLIIETKNCKSDAELRELLLKEIKAQGKEYGFFFKSVNGGFTQTDIRAINSFNVAPLEAYRVYLDGRPDELVRGVDLIGTPLTMFAGIMCAGGETKVFTGMCGAESGWIPVTAISPSILVKKAELQSKAKSNVVPPLTKKPSSKQ